MKSLTLCFRTQAQQRAILGACWSNGLDPATTEEDLPDRIVEILTSICTAEIKRRHEPKEKP